MSLRIEFLQRTPLILAAAAVAILVGPQPSNSTDQPAAPVWERSAGLQFDAVSFEAPRDQPVLTHQQGAKPAQLPFVAYADDSAEVQTSAQRWVF